MTVRLFQGGVTLVFSQQPEFRCGQSLFDDVTFNDGTFKQKKEEKPTETILMLPSILRCMREQPVCARYFIRALNSPLPPGTKLLIPAVFIFTSMLNEPHQQCLALN